MRFLSYLISLIYSFIISFRNFLFDINLLKSREYDIPIICVGNLSIGGTGKTPHIEKLLDILSNKRTAVLSRGYGRTTNGLMLVKKDSLFSDVGDESLQIKQKFPTCKVIISENRRKGIEYILKELPGIEVILMDDGFQHRWVKAGLNIILNNYHHPFYNDYMFPLGKLREDKYAIKRANIIITSKCPKGLNPDEKQSIIKKLDLLPSQYSFFSEMQYSHYKDVFTNNKINISERLNITLITSISDPIPLIKFLKEKHNSVHHIKFADHYNYTTKDISNILREFNTSRSGKSIILTTEKDKVKLQCFKREFENVNFYFIPVKIIINNRESFNKQIIDYVTNHKRNRKFH